MTAFDLTPALLATYRSEAQEPADFDEAWARTLAQARQTPMVPRAEPVDVGLRLVHTYDVTFPGFAGDPVKAWLVVPAGANGRVPVVVRYHGYGGGRGLPVEALGWAAAGYAELVMDNRGQGSSWGAGGATPDPHGAGPALPGFMTRGIEAFETFYYRRLITDAVRAVDAARALPGLDPSRVAVTGGSQGGGVTLAVAGLADGLVAAMPEVPFLCDIRRGVDLSDTDPYGEVTRYLAVHRDRVEQVFDTLSYVDGVNHAARAGAPALFSVGGIDHVCPPSTVYGAFHAYAGPHEMVVYPYNGHEGGGAHQLVRQIAWLRDEVGVTPDAG